MTHKEAIERLLSIARERYPSVYDPPHVAHGIATCLTCGCVVFTARLRAFPGEEGIVRWDGSDHDWKVIQRELHRWWRPSMPVGPLVVERRRGRGEGHQCPRSSPWEGAR